jgi:peptide chain release factor 2
MKAIRLLEKNIASYEKLSGFIDDAELEQEIWQEEGGEQTAVDAAYKKAIDLVEELEFVSTLHRPEDSLGCILEINAGAGGTESCDWSEMLLRMYTMYAQRAGFKFSQLNRVDGEVAGIKSAEIEIEGDFAYGMLRGENGVHRLVRISPFNAQGKRQTSFASVFVHPMVDSTIKIEINPVDLDWDTFRASGAGGQHVNKTESAVRVRHLPSGLVVECQQERSQIQNRDKALQMLKSKLFDLEIKKQNAERDKVEAGKTKIEWGAQIRSYVLDDRWVKDLRTGHKVHNPDAVLDGDLDGFLKAFLMKGTVIGEEDEE